MATPPPGTELVVRPSARAIVIDPSFRTLMICGSDPNNPSRGRFWWTPGGGVDAGESLEEACLRELWEELGLVVADVDALGPVVMTRRSVFPMANVWYDSFESFFLVSVSAGFTPEPQDLEEIEEQAIRDIAWLAADQIRQMDEYVYPLNLPDFLDHVRLYGPPTEAWFEEGRDDRPENNPQLD